MKAISVIVWPYWSYAVGVNCCSDPIFIEAEDGERAIWVKVGGGGLTVTVAVAFFVVSATQVAVT